MIFLLPRKLEMSLKISAEDFLKELQNNIYIPTETGVFRINRIIRNHFADDIFYGSRRQNAFTVFHHRPFKNDGGGVRFNGVVINTADGCKVKGYIRHGLLAYVVAAVWVLILLMVSVVVFVENTPYTLFPLGFAVLGIFVIFRDFGNAKRLRAFIEKLCNNNAN